MKPKRIQLRRTKGWRLPPNTVVVSRPSKWGNPFVAGPRDQRAHDYKVALLWELVARSTGELTEDRHMRRVAADLADLRGKNLACWCPIGEPCHADVLLVLANRMTARPNDPSSAPAEDIHEGVGDINGGSLQRMGRRLARVAEDMRKLGADMVHSGGFGLLGDRGREMLGAAEMANGWTRHIAKMAETLDGKAKPADKTKDKTIPCLNGDGRRMQARMFRQCIKELGARASDVRDYAGSEVHNKLAAQNAAINLRLDQPCATGAAEAEAMMANRTMPEKESELAVVEPQIYK